MAAFVGKTKAVPFLANPEVNFYTLRNDKESALEVHCSLKNCKFNNFKLFENVVSTIHY